MRISRINKQNQQLKAINRKEFEKTRPSIIPRRFVRYLDYVKENYYYKKTILIYNVIKPVTYKIFYVAIWSFFILVSFNLFDILKLNFINFLKCIPFYFLLMEIVAFIERRLHVRSYR